MNEKIIQYENMILWAVDVQNDFMNDDGALYVPGANSIKPNITKLVRFAEQYHIPIFGSVDCHEKNDPEFTQFPPHCIRGTEGALPHNSLMVVDSGEIRRHDPENVLQTIRNIQSGIEVQNYVFFEKKSIDIFSDENANKTFVPHLLPFLQQSTVIIFGVATEYCVRAAVLGFLKHGCKVFVIEDAIAGVSSEKSAEALVEMQIEGAEVVNLNDLIETALYERLEMNIHNYLKTYLYNADINSLVIGISGGIDSALTVALAKPVCDELGIPLIGVWMGIESNTEEEHNRAMAIGREFCTEFIDLDLTASYQYLYPNIISKTDFNDSSLDAKIRRGNIKARIRMIYLYNLAHERKGLVLATGNLTEILLGFWTLHGDVGDLSLINSLLKTTVYKVATHIAEKLEDDNSDLAESLMECVEAKATDGLGISDSDNDQLDGKCFEEIDYVLLDMQKGIKSSNLNHPTAIRARKRAWKADLPIMIDKDLSKANYF